MGHTKTYHKTNPQKHLNNRVNIFTKPKLQIDIWLANHPFYTDSSILIDSEGRVEKFMKKYQLNLKK